MPQIYLPSARRARPATAIRLTHPSLGLPWRCRLLTLALARSAIATYSRQVVKEGTTFASNQEQCPC